jgi:Ca2+/Na+ antiporter
MAPVILYTLGISISAILLILITNKPELSKSNKIIIFIIGNAGFFIAQYTFSGFAESGFILTLSFFVLLDVFVIRSFFVKEHPDHLTHKAWSEDPNNWKAGLFYYNPLDKRIFPPKRTSSMGWTINFANPYSVIVFILSIILIVIGILMLIR